MTQRPPAGTTARLNDRCPWPERRGHTAHVVTTDGSHHAYPASALGPREVIVHIPNDPLDHRLHLLANGHAWTCVVSIDALDIEDPA